MSETTKKAVDTSSEEFNEGVEAGLNSSDDTKNWQAGNELGQELKDDDEDKAAVSENILKESPSTPLFVINSPEGDQGNAQDEKDESEE